jgi:hypothetical protein
VGSALLISFWSSELAADVCEVDEIFVGGRHRGERTCEEQRDGYRAMGATRRPPAAAADERSG